MTPKTEEYEGYKIVIEPDMDAVSPDQWDNESIFIVTTRNPHFEVIPKGYDVRTISEYIATHKYYREFQVFPLIAYVHSGVALSLSRERYPFNDQWDSGRIGHVLVKRKDFPPKKRLSAAESLVEAWNQYLSGDVWGYTISKCGEELDSLWGMYGFEYCKKEAMEWVDYHIKQLQQLSGGEK